MFAPRVEGTAVEDKSGLVDPATPAVLATNPVCMLTVYVPAVDGAVQITPTPVAATALKDRRTVFRSFEY